MSLPSVAPATYRRITLVALWLLVFIVVTGGAVRLTGSGLGCSDWPTCEEDRFVAAFDFHPMVEFVNRAITGLVSAAIAVAVLGSLRRTPRRRDLTWLSVGLVAGVIGQILLGKLVVETDLNPVLVQGHFVLSMVLIADAVVLHHRAGHPDGPDPTDGRPGHSVSDSVRHLASLAIGAAAVVILTGTVVTGAGPHAGDLDAKRLDVAVGTAARVHGLAMIAFLAVVLAIIGLLRRQRAPATVFHLAHTLVTVLVLQAAVGYTQYFTDVPPLLVGMHILGACLVWVAVLRFRLGLSSLTGHPRQSSDGQPGGAHHRTGGDLVTHR